jgi:hypothetical protein
MYIKGIGTAITGTAFLVRFSPFRRRGAIAQVPGPPSSSWFFGAFRFRCKAVYKNLTSILDSGNIPDISVSTIWGEHEFDWQKQYGPVYRIKGCLGVGRLHSFNGGIILNFIDYSIIDGPAHGL